MSGDVTGGAVAGLPPDDPALRARQHAVLSDYHLLDLPHDDELDAVTRVAAALAGTPWATVNLLDTERQCQVSTFGFAGADSPRSEALCDRASRFRGLFLSPDLSADPRFADSAWVDGRWAAVRLYASAPLVVEGTTIGTLCVLDQTPGTLSTDQLDRLADLAGIVVALLERRRAHRVAEEARAELVRTQAFERALLDALPVGIVAADAERRVTLFNQASRTWHRQGVVPELTDDDLPGAHDYYEPDGTTPLPASRVPLLRVFEEGTLAGAEMVVRPGSAAPRTVSCSGSEVRGPDGELLGAVVAMADVTEQRELELQLRAAALHDGLTGLPNRSLLVDRLQHALTAAGRGGAPLAVLYCDLDGFKAVNDAHGHAAGDEVLAQAAVRLSGAVRPGDTVARIGGDEFVLLCAGVDDARVAAAIARRVVATMADPICSTDATHHVGVSVGVALSGPGSTPETMLTAADEDMYRVKRARRGPSRRG